MAASDPTAAMDRLEAYGDALHWVRVTFLQIDRFFHSYIDFAESDDRDLTRATADGHFLLNACGQAEKALRAIRPITGQIVTIRSLRNIHEHWEQHRESFASKDLPKTRAGKTFNDEHPEYIPFAYKLDATGLWISALRIEDLWTELVEAEKELGALIEPLAATVGVPFRPAPERVWPQRETKVLAMAAVTQKILLTFSEAEPEP